MKWSTGEELDRYIEEHWQQQIEDVCRLVSIDSSRSAPAPGKPFGRGAAEVLAEALSIAENKGFSTRCIEDCIGCVEEEAPDEGVDILSHLDVVPAGTGWTVTRPFSPLLSGERLYGRGTADNKGPSVAVLYALEAVRSLNKPFKRRVRILWGTAEETGSEDLTRYYKKYKYFFYLSDNHNMTKTNLRMEKDERNYFSRRVWYKTISYNKMYIKTNTSNIR